MEELVQGRTASQQGTGLKHTAAWFLPFCKGGDITQLFSLEMGGGVGEAGADLRPGASFPLPLPSLWALGVAPRPP